MRCDLSRSAGYRREGYTWEEDVAEVGSAEVLETRVQYTKFRAATPGP